MFANTRAVGVKQIKVTMFEIRIAGSDYVNFIAMALQSGKHFFIQRELCFNQS